MTTEFIAGLSLNDCRVINLTVKPYELARDNNVEMVFLLLLTIITNMLAIFAFPLTDFQAVIIGLLVIIPGGLLVLSICRTKAQLVRERVNTIRSDVKTANVTLLLTLSRVSVENDIAETEHTLSVREKVRETFVQSCLQMQLLILLPI